MALVTQVIPSFNGGVSQQPDRSRFVNQLTKQVNGFSSEVEGLQKRPPTIHISTLDSLTSDASKRKYHVINRDETEQYIASFGSNSVQIHGLDGVRKTVNITNSSYLNTSDPVNDIRCVTIADYTFVLNKIVVPTMSAATTSTWNDNWALVYCKAVNYAKAYALYIDDQFAVGVLLPDGSKTEHSTQCTTARVIQQLNDLFDLNGSYIAPTKTDYWQLVNDYSSGTTEIVTARNSSFPFSNYTHGLYGDAVLGIRYKDGRNSIPKVVVKDGMGNTNMYAMLGVCQSTTKLPPYAPDQAVVKMQSEKNNEDSTYYLRYDTSKNAWLETIKGGCKYALNANTMPHALVRNSDGTFTFKPLDWSNRRVGDEDTNPDPSFVDTVVNDIFFFRNRLGLVADENVILSTTSDFFNFWFNSSAAITDTDPIDVALSSNKVSIITDVVPFAKELMLFSREGQFVLKAEGVLTPQNVAIDQTTAFNYSPNSSPIPLGQSLYFMTERVRSSSLMRYFTAQDISENKDAEDVSSHVPTYIPTKIKKLSGATSESVIFMTPNGTNKVYVYKYVFANNIHLQQSFSEWTFGVEGSDEVILCEFIGATVYLIIKRNGVINLEKITLTGSLVDFTDEPYRLLIDSKRRVTGTKTYDKWTGKTTIQLPVTMRANEKFSLVSTDGVVLQSSLASTGSTFVVDGDYSGYTFFFGRDYTFDAILTKLMLKENTETGVDVTDNGRLQVRSMKLNYSDSGTFKVKVNNTEKNRSFTYSSTGKNLGTKDTIIGKAIIQDGTFKFPVQDINTSIDIEIIGDTPEPVTILSGSFDALYVPNTRRL